MDQQGKVIRNELFEGPGSGIDADTLDGVHYEAIAAQFRDITAKVAALLVRLERLERR